MLAVVEPIEPPELYDWFVDAARGARASTSSRSGRRRAPKRLPALRDNRIVCLLSDRDLTGDGVEVEFFGERTTLPGGPATLALRTGATLLPAAVYFRPGRNHHAVVRPPLPVEREGRLREDVARITQQLAHEFETLIRAAPEQWHLMQPNWPSDRSKQTEERSERAGRDDVSPYSLSRPGGVQGQVLGLARELRRLGIDVRVLAPVRRPAPGTGRRVRRAERRVELERFGRADRDRRRPRRAGRRRRCARSSPTSCTCTSRRCPGPCLSTLIGFDGPMVGTFHASGELLHQWSRPAMRGLMSRLTSRVVVSEAARETAVLNWGGDYDVLWNGIEIDRFADATPTPSDVPAVLFIGRHEPRKGLEVLLDAWRGLDRDAVLWVAVERPADEGAAQAQGRGASSGSGSISDRELEQRHAGRDGLLRAVAAR